MDWVRIPLKDFICNCLVTSQLQRSLSHLTCFLRGFIAQSVDWHRTGIAEIMGPNPVEASEFFLGFICNCLSYFTTAKITFPVLFFIRSSLIWSLSYTPHHIITSQKSLINLSLLTLTCYYLVLKSGFPLLVTFLYKVENTKLFSKWKSFTGSISTFGLPSTTI